MNDSDLRNAVLAAALTAGGSACSLVLDLDAEGDAAEGGGGSALAGTNGAPSGSTTSSSSSPQPTTSSGAQQTASSSTGTPTVCDGYATFDGSQLFRLADDHALELVKNFVLQARIRPEPASLGGPLEEGAILSRMKEADEKGYEFVIFERGNQGVLYPELRLYVASEPCTCEGAIALSGTDWARVAAGFSSSGKTQATVWVDDVEACRVECDGDKISGFSAKATVGRAMEGGSYFRGAIAELVVRQWNDGQLSWGDLCGAAPLFALGFDHALPQVFTTDCSGSADLTFGVDAAVAPDDPQLVLCP